jgi:peptidoglycan/LPS O-acetylase OafA/YrhL
VRSTYLDVIRGLACLQVLMLHLAEAFFPLFATDTIHDHTLGGYVHASPLYLIYDGYTGVFVFFLLSGYVLTPSFSKDYQPARQFAARWVRLLIPAFMACLLSLLIKWLVFDLNPTVRASEISGSVFLKDWWRPDLTLANLLHDSFLNALFMGYAETSALFSDAYLQSIETSFVAPLWTLSVEMHGSILLLGLISLRKHSRLLYMLGLIVACVLFIRTYYILFIIGHLINVKTQNAQHHQSTSSAILFLVTGMTLCFTGETSTLGFLENVCQAGLPLSLDCSGHIQKMIGAILMFYGLLHHKGLKDLLQGRILEQLGRYSFSIYLVHFPILCGIGSAVVILTAPLYGASTSLVIGALVTLATTFAIAPAFHHIDRLAMRVSSYLRGPVDPRPL